MPRPGLAYDDVAQSIHLLEKAGLNPSIRMIRDKLGKGSLTTIAEHKRAYEVSRADGPTEVLPDPITKALIQGARGFWQELVDAAEAEIMAVKDQAASTETNLNLKLQQSDDEIATLNDSLGGQAETLRKLEGMLEEQSTQLMKRDDTIHAHEVATSRLQAEYGAAQARTAELQETIAAQQEQLKASESERARLSERLDHQAAAHAQEKSSLQKQFTEHKDQLVTMSADLRVANDARREAEKAAAATGKQAALLENDSLRITRELKDANDETRVLIEQVGELRGQIAAAKAHQADERSGFERLLEEKTERASTLDKALDEAQRLVRQFVPAGTELAQALIDERKAEKD